MPTLKSKMKKEEKLNPQLEKIKKGEVFKITNKLDFTSKDIFDEKEKKTKKVYLLKRQEEGIIKEFPVCETYVKQIIKKTSLLKELDNLSQQEKEKSENYKKLQKLKSKGLVL